MVYWCPLPWVILYKGRDIQVCYSTYNTVLWCIGVLLCGFCYTKVSIYDKHNDIDYNPSLYYSTVYWCPFLFAILKYDNPYIVVVLWFLGSMVQYNRLFCIKCLSIYVSLYYILSVQVSLYYEHCSMVLPLPSSNSLSFFFQAAAGGLFRKCFKSSTSL